jgi:NO-binding membrane sensor protein with MHYT domain
MGSPKSYAFDFKGKIIAKNIFVVSLAIGIIRSIVALRSGRRRVRSPSAKYRHQTIPIRKRGAMSGLNLHFAG